MTEPTTTPSETAQPERLSVDELRSLSAEGVAVVRLSPFRRRHLPAAQDVADLLEPLDRAIRNLRVLVRRAASAVRRDEAVPPSYVDLVEELSRSCDDIARQLHERQQPLASRPGLERLGRVSTRADPHASLSGEVIRGQVRSMVVDLLVLTGMGGDEAAAHVPVSPAP